MSILISLRENLRKYQRILKEKLGLGKIEDPQRLDTEEYKGYSDYTLALDFPSITITQREPFMETGTSGGTGLAPRYLAKLQGLERNMEEVVRSMKILTELTEGNKNQLIEHAQHIAQINRKVSEMDGISEGYSSMESNLRELAILYDLISAHANPFIDLRQDLEDSSPKERTDSTENQNKVKTGMSGTISSTGSTGLTGSNSSPGSSSSIRSTGLTNSSSSPGSANSIRSTGLTDSSSSPGSANSIRSTGLTDSISSTGSTDSMSCTGSTDVLLEWMNFLLERITPQGIAKLLAYYQEIGWIDKDIMEKANSYLRGLKLQDRRTEGDDDWRLSPEDQVKSRKFITEITNMEV